MPLTPSPDAGPRRRALLVEVLALGALGPLAAGCSGGGADGGGDAVPSAADVRAERRLRAAALRQSRALLARYDATAAAHAGLADRLRPLRAAVARHVEAFGGRADTGRHRGVASGVPAGQDAALAALATAERRAADARTDALVTAPPSLARLLASVAAADAAHAYLLGRGA